MAFDLSLLGTEVPFVPVPIGSTCKLLFAISAFIGSQASMQVEVVFETVQPVE